LKSGTRQNGDGTRRYQRSKRGFIGHATKVKRQISIYLTIENPSAVVDRITYIAFSSESRSVQKYIFCIYLSRKENLIKKLFVTTTEFFQILNALFLSSWIWQQMAAIVLISIITDLCSP